MSKRLIFIEQSSVSPIIEAISLYLLKITTIEQHKIVINPELFKKSLETGVFSSVVIITHSDVFKIYCKHILGEASVSIEEASFLHIEDTITYGVLEAGCYITKQNHTYTITEFIANSQEILDSLILKNKESIFIKPVGDKNKYLPTNDILYLQGSTYYTLVRTKTGSSYKVQRSQKNMMTDLPIYFLKIHNSYTVNTKTIKNWNKKNVFLITGESLPIGATLASKLNSFMEFHFPLKNMA